MLTSQCQVLPVQSVRVRGHRGLPEYLSLLLGHFLSLSWRVWPEQLCQENPRITLLFYIFIICSDRDPSLEDTEINNNICAKVLFIILCYSEYWGSTKTPQCSGMDKKKCGIFKTLFKLLNSSLMPKR